MQMWGRGGWPVPWSLGRSVQTKEILAGGGRGCPGMPLAWSPCPGYLCQRPSCCSQGMAGPSCPKSSLPPGGWPRGGQLWAVARGPLRPASRPGPVPAPPPGGRWLLLLWGQILCPPCSGGGLVCTRGPRDTYALRPGWAWTWGLFRTQCDGLWTLVYFGCCLPAVSLCGGPASLGPACV